MAPPGGGPDVLLIQGTTPLKAVHEVSTPAEARLAVQEIAARKIAQLKIWVDDRDARRGSMQKMPPDVIAAVIEEAHKRGITVHAHATTLPNQKAVVSAGADVLVHTVGNERIDDEFMAILREKRPYWASVMGLTDTPEVCEPNNAFVEQSLPDSTIADIKAGRNAFKLPGCDNINAAANARREETWKFNVTNMVKSGARLVLATDAGVLPGYSFGWAEHHEMGMYVRLGLSPAEVIVAATSRPAEVMKLRDSGTIATGKQANFIVLQKDPLVDIRNTRTIESVYLAGQKLDREGIAATLKVGIPGR
jgi:imidazolonepropionase-like amidohydrolase